MIICQWDDLVAGRCEQSGPAAVTIGVFDGVHIGHRELVVAVVETSEPLRPVVVTFTRHPQLVLAGRAPMPAIMTMDQKLAALERLGVEGVVLIDFTVEFSKLPGGVFLDRLTRAIDARLAVVGSDFRCGRNRDTGAGELASILSSQGIQVDVRPKREHGGEIVSSTRIRRAVLDGRFDEVRELLKTDFALVVPGSEAHRVTPGSIELNRTSLKQVAPERGTFEVAVTADSHSTSIAARVRCTAQTLVVEPADDGAIPVGTDFVVRFPGLVGSLS